MLTKAEREIATSKFKDGVSPQTIARLLRVTPGCVHMIARRAGLPPQKPRRAPKPILTAADERYQDRQRERNRQMRAFTAAKRAAGCPVKAESTMAAHLDAMARLALIPADTRTLTARFCGDPLPGRSALDRRQSGDTRE